MEYLHVAGLEHSYGSQRVLENVSFSIRAGERLCLLGPSGCGKTTTLQVLAGFVKPDRGQVTIKGEPLDGMPPEKRNIGIMFQNYALFPHMSVFDNVAFGLRMRGLEKKEITTRVGDALTLVRLPHTASKRPAQLSGGEQQRIAFARAIVIRPRLLLLDEPFSNLDARLRLEMRTELLDLLRELDVATVMVTHDQEEAMAIADRIAVMYKGRIEQIDIPNEVYSNPSSLFVARFVGETNVFDGRAMGHDKVMVDGLGEFSVRKNQSIANNSKVKLLVRPEHIELAEKADMNGQWNTVEGTVERLLFLGHRTEWVVRKGEARFLVWQSQPHSLMRKVGDTVTLRWRPSDCFLVASEHVNA
ncbi:putative spermidine/putrescine transport system ATP-binding protein [Mesorhizobium sp. J18]|uniref:ABC transporter ATP-binding protein n=1 Tax=Mesorhizobium sp. J18 TaxID=935263 RepID=UPI0011996D12|nr:ABC transporter ATP-binding protein [Mesorhizobium sp. J18]TWG91790.1 putative spermidine/putrescine transport system ATP-binding protein [Mesorhizobium sp. J18]